MAIFASRFLWNPVLRVIAFWGVVVGVFVAISSIWSWINFHLLVETIYAAVWQSDISGVTSRKFAFSLASALFTSALALGVAYAILHTLMIWLAIAGVKRSIKKTDGMSEFATSYGEIHGKLERHPLLSHAWKEFDETLVPPKEAGGVYRNTVRPQAFINMSVMRDHLLGLKLIGAIPGYFVGIGLLLTFIGLVLALNEAATAVTSADAATMQAATRRLLQVATFKFSTSIAGLGASILLSFWFKLNLSIVENALEALCKTIEQKLRYTAPQSITAEMNDTMASQLTELKQINSADFFSRMGEGLSPQIESAFATAIAPVTQSIDQAVGKLADNSQTGMTDMVNSFKESIQGGAGTELRELAATLQGMQGALLDAQRGINGSGEDFGRRMSEAAEHLKRLVSEAGERLDASSEQSRAAMVDVVTALRETMERANRNVDQSLGQAASGASAKIEEAMGRVLGRLEEQIDGFNSGLGAFQTGMSRNLEETRTQVAAAQAGAAEAVGSAAADAAKALREGLAAALATIRQEVERFAAAMRGTEASMTAQSDAVRQATDQSRAVADAFSRTAQDVRVASAPLTQSSARIAGATEKMAEAIARSVTALEAGQAASRSMTEALAQHHDQLANAWASYSQRFENVDKSLAAAVEGLSKAARDQGEVIAKHVQEVDHGFADAIGKLNGLLAGIEESTQDLGEGVESLRTILLPQAAE